MKMQFVFVLFLIAIFQKGFTQAAVDSNFHLYLLAGQSNMAGRGEIAVDNQPESDTNVLMLTKNGDWVVAKNPLHFDKPKAVGVGPGLSFGIAMAAARPGVKIGLVPCAVGGTSIDVWQPGGYDSATKTHPYDDAVVRIKMALQKGVFKGIIWHQGESDSDSARASEYLPKLIVLIDLLRKETRNENLPFVAGELGAYKPQYGYINAGLAQLPKQVTNTAVASSQGLTHKGDLTHFNTASAEELGKRYAVKMLELQNR